jgi:FixJ family two-component response regulator
MAKARPLAVYVVDDDAAIRDSLALMLGLAGYSTRLFSDAESFLVAFNRRGPAAWSPICACPG